MMKLLIEIPDEHYNTIKSDLYGTFPAEMKKWGLEAIRNGTPLSDEAVAKIEEIEQNAAEDKEWGSWKERKKNENITM